MESRSEGKLVHCHSQNVGCGKGVRSQLCEAPVGPFRQLTPDPFTTTTPKLNGDKAQERNHIDSELSIPFRVFRIFRCSHSRNRQTEVNFTG